MKKSIASLLFFFVFTINAKEINKVDTYLQVAKDSIIYYNKTTSISKKRLFTEDLKNKYSEEDFKYQEDTYDKNEKGKKTFGSQIIAFFAFFLRYIFPFLLGGFVIFVILKVVFGADISFLKTNKNSQKLTKKLIYEDEDIYELNLEKILQEAIKNKKYRLAIRYYYLTALKILSNHKIIDYHKDKTNSEYLSEIKNRAIQSKFSYLSYVYSYVWYGEFTVNETNFKKVESKYKSFLKSLV